MATPGVASMPLLQAQNSEVQSRSASPSRVNTPAPHSRNEGPKNKTARTKRPLKSLPDTLTKTSAWTFRHAKHIGTVLSGWWRSISVPVSRFYRRGWTAEACALVFAALSLTGLAIFLLAYQNQPLPDWPQLITINAMVSLFTMLVRSGVMMALAEGISQSKWQWFRKPHQLRDMEIFDHASRGPWGSWTLLACLRPRKSLYVATTGAILTLLVSATGFFMQQVLLFGDCFRKDTSQSAALARTYDFSATMDQDISNETYFPMVTAINSGIMQSQEDLTSVLLYGCSSGSCKFSSDNGAAFSTVGISFLCEDFTSEILRSEKPPTDNDSSTHSIIQTWHWPETHSAGTPEELTLEDSTDIVFKTAVDPMVHSSNTMIASLKFLYRVARPERQTTPAHAIGCSLFPSINTYTIDMARSQLHETLISSTRMGYNFLSLGYQPDPFSLDPSDETYPWFRLVTNTTLRNGKWESCNSQATPAPGFVRVALRNVEEAPFFATTELPYIDPFDPLNRPDPPPTTYVPVDCVWSFESLGADEIAGYFAEILSDQTLEKGLGSADTGSVFLRQLYRDGAISLESVSAMMETLTTRMTAVIRTHGAEGMASFVRGDVMQATTCVTVRWEWLAYPASMIVLSAVFLVLASFESRDRPTGGLWKSSVLAALFCEVDEEVVLEKLRKDCMEDVASSTSVRLEQDGGRLRLAVK